MNGRDKLGPYIQYGEEFNRYEEFAASSDNFATVKEESPSSNFQGVFELYKHHTSADERRVLIHSDFVYGSRRPIERVVFDIAFSSGVWMKGASAASSCGPVQEAYDSELTLAVRSIATDFDPSSITWDDAYSGAGALSFGASAQVTLAMLQGTLAVDEQGPTGMASAVVDAQVAFPALLILKREDVAAWNSEDRIFGWEVSIAADGAALSAGWVGDAASEATACFAILK